MLMGNKTQQDIPGIAFVVDSLGRRKSVLIDLEQHGSSWEDLYDAYVAQQRRAEPRESLATVKRLVLSPGRRRSPSHRRIGRAAPTGSVSLAAERCRLVS